MAKATLSLSKKANPQGEHPILVRLDITRTNRPQFKSTVTVLPEYFADGEIKIPMRGKLNAAFRDELLKKKTDIDAFIASLTAISMALPEEARTRKDILEVYEVVKSVNPAEISRTTIIAKKKGADRRQRRTRPAVTGGAPPRSAGLCAQAAGGHEERHDKAQGQQLHETDSSHLYGLCQYPRDIHKTTPFRLGRHQRAVD